MLKKFWHVIGNVVFAILLVLVIVLAGFVVKGKIDGGMPAIANYRLYIVLSGSMHPVFDAGSLVVIKDADPGSIPVGAIIAFKDPGPNDSNLIITHRVVAVQKERGHISYVTKGDANNANDPLPVPAANVIGEADGWAPEVGYFFDFAKSRRGLICLIVLPGLLLAGGEIRNLFRYAEEWEDEEKKNELEGRLVLPGGGDGCFRRDCQGIRRWHIPSKLTDFQAGDSLCPGPGAGQIAVGRL